MKKSTIIIFLVITMLKTQAQDCWIGFAAAGDTNMVSNVKVDNLTSGAIVTLNGGDILHLISPVGISTLDIDNGDLQIYPNPMTDQSILTFVAPGNSNAVICIVDISGRTVYKINTLLSPGAHSFRITGISLDIYLVKVTGNNYNYSTKLISQGNSKNEPDIEYASQHNCYRCTDQQ
jgi:Secretion system C-terminal sorting domain